MRRLRFSIRERRAGAVGASPAGPRLGRILLVSSLSGVVLAFLAPFGSDQSPLIPRLLYWVGIVAIGGLLGWATAVLVRRIPVLRDRPWLQALVTALAMTPPGTVVVWAWSRFLFPTVAPLGGVLEYAPAVLVISLAMSTVNLLAATREPVAVAEAPGAKPAPRFLARLPDRLKGAELYAVEAEDHYLRLHTSRGSDLILCRLADAVAELEGVDGLQTHRSWWVARQAVTAVVKADGRAVLTLASGAEAPVSRNALPKLREQGWV
jgi:hypothetical protein